MFIHIYKNELKSFFKSSNFLSFLFIMAIMVALDVFTRSLGSNEVLSMNIGSSLIIYVVLSQFISNQHSKLKDFHHEEEFYLSKPFLRNDLFKAKLFKVLTLCAIIMIILFSAFFLTSGSFSSKVRISGYDNILLADSLDELTPSYKDEQRKMHHEEDMQEIAELIQAGKFKEAELKKQEGYFSKKYQMDYLYIYDYAIKFMLLIWCSICGLIYISMKEVKTPADMMKENFKHPLGYLKMTGWGCVFAFILMPLLDLKSGSIMHQHSANFLSYLINFNQIIVSFLILTAILIFITKRSYQKISL